MAERPRRNGTDVDLFVWPYDPELQRMAELVDAILGPAALGCPDCGDLLDGPALIKRCQSQHKAATS